jgi:polyphenol oxidase
MYIITPNWPAPHFVKAYTIAHPKEDGLHAKKHFLNFKQYLQNHFSFPKEPIFLEQTHSDRVIQTDLSPERTGDASISQTSGQALVIMTADCLPILISHRHQKEIANIHAGWKGLYSGIIEKTFLALKDKPERYMAWIGPAICQSCYEVGESFRDKFLQKDIDFAQYFEKKQDWHFNLAKSAEHILQKLGVEEIYQSQCCTYEQEKLFSYRREKENASRLGSIIWLED